MLSNTLVEMCSTHLRSGLIFIQFGHLAVPMHLALSFYTKATNLVKEKD